MNLIDKNFFRYPDLAAWQADHDEGIIPADAMVLVDKEGVVCRGNTVYRQIYVCPGNVQGLTTASTPQQITAALGSFADFKAAMEARRPLFFRVSQGGDRGMACASFVSMTDLMGICAIYWFQAAHFCTLGLNYDSSGWKSVGNSNMKMLAFQE